MVYKINSKIVIKGLLIAVMFLALCISLSGCCGHSGGGNNLNPSNKTTIGEARVNSDGSVSFSGDGISLNALPDTFKDGTIIKFTKVTGGNLLSYLGMDGKDITLDSDVYGIEISPEQELLNNAATLTIDLVSDYDSNKKYYFSVNRETPTLVTSENNSTSLSVRTAAKKQFELGFITTFSYVALAHLKKELLSKDPSVWCDNSSKDVINNKYTSDVTIFSQLTTKDKINDVFSGNVSFKLAVRTDSSKLNKLNHKNSPLTTRKSQGKSSLIYAYIDLINAQSLMIDDHTLQYDAFFNSLNKTFQDIPRRVVLESVFTNKENIPISSQEYLIFFRSAKRPFVTSTYPANNDIITNAAQLENIVVNFSEAMNTDSVEEAIAITTKGQTYSKSKWNLNFNWSDSNKKLSMNSNFTLKNATGTFNIKIAKSAYSASNSNIAKTAYSAESEDIQWSFKYNKKDFYVVMTSPKPGDTNVPIVGNTSSNKGPDIILTFSENSIPRSGNLDSAISIKTAEGNNIKFSGRTDMDEKNYILTPKRSLSYNTIYIVEVVGSIENIEQNKTLGETYRASFKTKEPFASGSGIQGDPYMITNQEELDNIRIQGYINTNKYFKLANDIKYVKSSTIANSNNAYWKPIGDEDIPFTGHFDGNNKSVCDFVVSQKKDFTGLFGKVVNSTITNLNIKNPDINGNEYVGSLAGYCVYSNISNVKVTDIDINATSERTGGLIGVANSTQINKCSVESSDNLFGTTDYCGGIAGIITANSTLSNSYVKVLDNAELGGSDLIGGLVGYSENSKITGSKFYGIIKASSMDVGGIVGKASNSTISKCASVEGSASGSMDIGGICGNLVSNSIVEQCYSSLNISGAAHNVGGLVGNAENSSIINTYVTNKDVDSSGNCTGGLVGLMKNSELAYSYSLASVAGADSVGGLVGMASGSVTIRNSAALNSELAGTNKDNLNKIAGKGNPTITNSYSLSKMTISFVGTQSESDSYQHKTNSLDGKEKDKIGVIISNLALDESIWNLSKNNDYPEFK